MLRHTPGTATWVCPSEGSGGTLRDMPTAELPPKAAGKLRIVAISDTHMLHAQVGGVAGRSEAASCVRSFLSLSRTHTKPTPTPSPKLNAEPNPKPNPKPIPHPPCYVGVQLCSFLHQPSTTPAHLPSPPPQACPPVHPTPPPHSRWKRWHQTRSSPQLGKLPSGDLLVHAGDLCFEESRSPDAVLVNELLAEASESAAGPPPRGSSKPPNLQTICCRTS